MHEKQFAELRDCYIKARSRAEIDEILSKAQNPEEANRFFEEGLGDLCQLSPFRMICLNVIGSPQVRQLLDLGFSDSHAGG